MLKKPDIPCDIMTMEREKGATKMTFLICYHGTSYHLDVETLDDLASLADKYGWINLVVDFHNMTITIK